MKKCKKCGFENLEHASFCNRCGNSLPIGNRIFPKINLGYWALGLIAVLVIFGLVVAGVILSIILSRSPNSATSPKNGSATVQNLGLTPDQLKAREEALRVDEEAKRKNQEEAAAAEQKNQKEAAAAEAKWLKTKAGKIWWKHQDWSREICQVIAKRQVQIGMTKEQVIASWGKPDDINRTVGTNYEHEQWVYDRGDFKMQLLYFENGIMTSFQDN